MSMSSGFYLKNIFMVFIIVGLILFIVLISWHNHIVSKAKREVYNFTRKEVGEDLINCSYWFSGRPYTYNVLQSFGRALIKNQGLDVSKIRDEADKLGEKD